MQQIATTGNKGKGIRSDCFVTLELTAQGGIQLEVESKVEVMYGDSIRSETLEILNFFGIDNAILKIEDTGAIPLVIAARLEAAIKKLIKTDKDWAPKIIEENRYTTAKDRNRFSRLYLPGNSPSLMINAGIHKPDGIILDLEDAVAPDKKDEARFLVRNALCGIDFYGAERMVRINQGERGIEDLNYIIPFNVNLILLPKCEKPEQLYAVNDQIKIIQKKFKITDPVWIMPIIESALGVINAYAIASSVDNVAAMAIGLEDYTADLGTRRTAEGNESFFARSMVVNAARAASIQPIDSVFSDVGDMEGLRQNVLRSKALGFDGMGCIHPRQIQVIHETFAPTTEEIEKAKKIVSAFHKANEKGLGVVSLGTKMIDPPVVKRALNTINLAVKMNKLAENWRESYEQI
ncbi:MAG: aldolase/citrate lyase family protein [Bacteroidales bacterium]|nr:aldolase/citrate lyase family protein [Bacteroidales bacterium]MDD4603804.1 aldolase/citrate lyase family protein [Bacteroidales bacterium]